MPATAVSPIVTALSPLREAGADLVPLEVATSFLDLLDALPDPRRPQGRRHTLTAIVGLAICAVLADADNYSQIAAWIHDSDTETRTAFGAGEKPASESATRRLLQALDADAFDVATCAWIEKRLRDRARATRARRRRRACRLLAVDGKTLRGSAGSHTPRRHLLAVFDAATGVVCAQVDVGVKTNEITRFATVLDHVDDLCDTVVTADALHTQRAHALYLDARGGHYLLTIKRNQPKLHDRLAAFPWGQVPVQASSFNRALRI